MGRNRDTENGLVGPAGGGEGGMNGESGTDVCPRVKQTGSGKLLGSTRSSAQCCDGLEGGDGGGGVGGRS